MKTDFRRPVVLFSRVISCSARHTAVDGGTSRKKRSGGRRERKLSVSRSNPLAYLPLLRTFPIPQPMVGGRERRPCRSGITPASFSVSGERDVKRFPIDISSDGGADVFPRVSNGPEESGGTRNGFMRLHVSSRCEAARPRVGILYGVGRSNGTSTSRRVNGTHNGDN